MSFAATRFRGFSETLANAGLSLLLVVHMAALLLFALTLLLAQPARAEDQACGAEDLVAELKQKDPAAYEKLLAEGAKIKNSGVRFWKLEKPGQETNWLLGTMHLTDPRVTNLPAEASAAYDSASTIVLESDEILNPQTAAMKLMAKPELMMFTGQQSITDYLNADQQKLLEDGLLKRGIPFGTMVKMKPWILSSMIALSTCEFSRKAKGAAFLDMKLAQDGLAAGKKVLGVETLAEQIEAMSSLPMEFHIKALVAAARYPDFTADMMETTLQLYLDGNVGMVFPASTYFSPEKSASDVKDAALFEEKLITMRNHTMAERAAPILAAGQVFMAVGALHLVGDQGLVELFRKQGYVVTAVK